MAKSLTNTPSPKYLPTNDVIFKCLLGNPGNERITKSFLEHITGEKIEEISTNFKLELLKEKPKDKQMVADLIAKDKYLQKYIVEMQRKAYDYLPDRFIAYLSKTYVADIKVKEDYKKLKRTVLVVLIEEDFPNLESIQEYHTVWHYREENHKEKILTKNTEIHILELQKYKRYKNQTGEIDPWLEFFINPYGEEVQNMARTRAELEEAVRQLRLLNADEEVQQLADAEDWARYDYNSAMSEMKEKGLAAGKAEGRAEGLAEGHAKGRAEGIAEGIEEGIAQGEKRTNLKIVRKMLEKKMDINLISELTGLTEEENKKSIVKEKK